jgi:hypothetical protein
MFSQGGFFLLNHGNGLVGTGFNAGLAIDTFFRIDVGFGIDNGD